MGSPDCMAQHSVAANFAVEKHVMIPFGLHSNHSTVVPWRFRLCQEYMDNRDRL